jgi:hypothetical protein
MRSKNLKGIKPAHVRLFSTSKKQHYKLAGFSMNTQAIFGVSILMSFVASIMAAKLYAWPRLRTMNRNDALVPLVAPHMFLRTIGLGFLVSGVVPSSLPASVAVPAAHGDLIAGVLAMAAALTLAQRASWAIGLVWVFNLWGGGDLLHAYYQGAINARIDPGALERRSTSRHSLCHHCSFRMR